MGARFLKNLTDEKIPMIEDRLIKKRDERIQKFKKYRFGVMVEERKWTESHYWRSEETNRKKMRRYPREGFENQRIGE